MGEPILDKFMKKILDSNRTLTIYEVMKRTKVSRQTIYNWIEKGLPVTRTKLRELRFSMTEVDQFLADKKNERQRMERKPRKAVKIDQKYFEKLLKMVPGKQVVSVVDLVIEKGLKRYEVESKLDLSGHYEKMIRIEKELYKKLLLISVDLDVSIYKVANGIIRLGLSNS
jgi:excisionase family DNA binding protein